MSFSEFGVLWAAAIRRCYPTAPAPMNDDEVGDFFADMAALGLATQVQPTKDAA